MTAWAPLIALALAAPAEVSTTAVPQTPTLNAISLELPSLLGNLEDAVTPRGSAAPQAGLEVNGERFTPDGRWSGVVALGARWSHQGETFAEWTFAGGLEARFWFQALRLPFMREQGGPMLGARADGSLTRATLAGLGNLDGSSTSFDSSLSLRGGYRFVFGGRVELTPEVGAGIDQMQWLVGDDSRPMVVLGLTVGYLL